jgi:hypothetical protein
MARLPIEAHVAASRIDSWSRGWLFSPAIDLLFLCNLPWLLALAPLVVDVSSLPRVEFWQIYFLTTPHRWLTLLLVANDPVRRGTRSRQFVLLAVVCLAVVLLARWKTGGFACLALVDYLWNAWHFGSQHAGILRIYSRRAGGKLKLRGETWGVRILVAYTSLRLASWLTGWTEAIPSAAMVLKILDHLILVIPLALVLQEVIHFQPARLGAVVYLCSVSLLYGCLLWSVAHGIAALVLSLTVAASAFHAVEYLALVSFYAGQRRTQGPSGVFRKLTMAWGALILIYIVALGCMGYLLASAWFDVWIGLNLWAAFLHYAYDGMIWKLRVPATATIMGTATP